MPSSRIGLSGTRAKKLGQKYTTVDRKFAKKIKKYSWHLSGVMGYPHGTVQVGGKAVKIYLHRFIMLLMFGESTTGSQKIRIDHIDQNVYNNRAKNLRFTNQQTNCYNSRKLRKNNSSGFTGVHWDSRKKKWRAYTQQTNHGQRRARSLGRYTNLADAARAYNRALRDRSDTLNSAKHYNDVVPMF